MRFNPKARLDTSRTRNTGRGGGGAGRGGGLGGSGIPIPGGTKAGGGLAGILVIVLFVVLASCLGGGLPDLTGGGGSSGAGSAFDTSRMDDTGRYDKCETGADANEDVDCARVAVENSLYGYWSTTLPEQSNAQFEPEQAVATFTDSVSTGCGAATSAVGPFYCPPDSTIYLDTTFFKDVLEGELGGQGGAFVEPYVLAHEYGHHIQNLLGTMGKVKTQQGPRSDAVRLELQADCYAGMWARGAESTQDANGDVLIQDISEQDIREALESASAVGDDKIQQKTQGQVTEESWTHGSAASRMKWFQVGYQQGSLQACDTFAAGAL